MTFGDTPPLKSVNVDMKRRRRPSQALHMIWSLDLVPPPHWPPYGKMKTSFVTIAKAKTMIHENVPISCAQYAIEGVT